MCGADVRMEWMVWPCLWKEVLVQLGPYLILQLRMYLCWVTVLNVKCKTIKIPEGSIERLCGLGVRKDSSNKFQTHKWKICISLNCFFNFLTFFNYSWHVISVSKSLNLNVSSLKISVQ